LISYNERHDVATCLVGFNFDGFGKLVKLDPDKAEAQFRSLAEAELAKIAPALAKVLTDADLETQPIEIFFFPRSARQLARSVRQRDLGRSTRGSAAGGSR
jgi:hypothetical protein